ncbi:hypothetical protein LNP20_15585 [Klebsiella pneumoniae subsp. pneumoniae]|nr:hypothetical protein [Klebsiella pneumoniae subsp. pneumoniae]
MAAVGHWASFSCRASNSEGEMPGLKLAIVFLDNKRFFPRSRPFTERAAVLSGVQWITVLIFLEINLRGAVQMGGG